MDKSVALALHALFNELDEIQQSNVIMRIMRDVYKHGKTDDETVDERAAVEALRGW